MSCDEVIYFTEEIRRVQYPNVSRSANVSISLTELKRSALCDI